MIAPAQLDPVPRVPSRTREHASRSDWRYVLRVGDEPTTEELKLTQIEREKAERKRARTVPDEDEAEQHERRAEKARYLAEKLEERAKSEREVED
jgi:hypothetical protein